MGTVYFLTHPFCGQTFSFYDLPFRWADTIFIFVVRADSDDMDTQTRGHLVSITYPFGGQTLSSPSLSELIVMTLTHGLGVSEMTIICRSLRDDLGALSVCGLDRVLLCGRSGSTTDDESL